VSSSSSEREKRRSKVLDLDLEDSPRPGQAETTRRIANVISVLIPAREYRLECSWTTERPLPAVEEFACKLILTMGGVTRGELKSYFGLSAIEVDGLVESLERNRLVEVADDGALLPSVMLQTKATSVGDVPTFTTFETKDEDVVFDLLAFRIVPRRSYGNARFGLPELPIPDASRSTSVDQIAEAFSEQFRAYLEFARGRSRDNHKTKLYKVSRCRPQRTLQVPIDMELSVESGPKGELRIFRDAVERLGENRKRPLSNELESCVADYLASESITAESPSIGEFCALVGDEVLARYVAGNDYDLGRWLSDRDARRTGYGDSDTRAMLGPIYLTANRATLLRYLKQTEREDDSVSAIAHWLPADVPFWAANSSELAEFVPKFQKALGEGDTGKIVGCFFGTLSSEGNRLKKKFHGRLPHAVLFGGTPAQDRVEILVVPDRLVVVQYHLRPNISSAITLPIGFVSVDPGRIARVTGIAASRLSKGANASVLWSEDSRDVHSLVEFERLGLNSARGGADSSTN
jgi:hypothetical protein